jgi:hypothetical protein
MTQQQLHSETGNNCLVRRTFTPPEAGQKSPVHRLPTPLSEIKPPWLQSLSLFTIHYSLFTPSNPVKASQTNPQSAIRNPQSPHPFSLEPLTFSLSTYFHLFPLSST